MVTTVHGLCLASIDSLSLNPDSQLKTMLEIVQLEKTLAHGLPVRDGTLVPATPAS